jgi:MoxR-like ATPase
VSYIKHNIRALRNPNTCLNCGNPIAWWAHDTESIGNPDANYCAEHNSYSWVYITSDAAGTKPGERVDYRHVHYCPGETTPRYWPGPKPGKSDGNDDPGDEPRAEVKPEVKPDPNDPMAALKTLITSVARDAVADGAINEAEISRLIDLKVAAAKAAMVTQTGTMIQTALGEIGALPTRVEVKRADDSVHKVEGLAHFVLPKVIKLLGMKRHVYMAGPAGTGKSHIGQQAARALDLPFWAMSVGPTMLESKLLGYMDAKGDFIATAFYEWAKKGGIFLLDEVDNGNPSVLNVLNSALSNGFVLFPNGELVMLHDSCLCIAAANTWGTSQGANRGYVRQTLDLAFRDRFIYLEVPIDEALEQALCRATGLPSDRVDRALAYVRKCRSNALEADLPVSLGPRKAVFFCDLIANGFTKEESVFMALSAGISKTDWSKITTGAPSLYAV